MTSSRKPGFSLQFLVLAPQALRDFRFNPLRPTGYLSDCMGGRPFCTNYAYKIATSRFAQLDFIK
jgi:hypothetical protein